MFASRQLIALETRKGFLRDRIALRRARAVIEARRVARPLHVIEDLYAQWRRLSPVLKTLGVPFALWTGRRAWKRRRGVLGTALRWTPMIIAAVRGFQQARR
ncbi:MAG: hypothetical protein C0518_13355 [Opitutus sp.]|nr:hypothetical protein [Opitutus sp.]